MMKNVFILLFAAGLAVICAASAPAETGSAVGIAQAPGFASEPLTPPQIELLAAQIAAYGDDVCGALSSDLFKFVDMYDIEFYVRLNVTRDELKQAGLSMEDAIAKYAEAARAGIDPDEERPANCKVTGARFMDCQDVFKLMAGAQAADGGAGSPEKMSAAAAPLNFNACGTIAVSAAAGGKSRAQVFVVGRTGETWKILMAMDPEKSSQ